MRLPLLCAVVASLVSACASAPPQGPTAKYESYAAEAAARQQAQVDAIRDAMSSAGWRVDCTRNRTPERDLCMAGAFGSGPGEPEALPFRILFYRTAAGTLDGPVVAPGFNTDPARPPEVRVDGNAPITDMRSPALIEQLKSGRSAYALYHLWLSGPEDMRIDLRGFDEAYARLLAAADRLRQQKP